jgi:hypothetical protein
VRENLVKYTKLISVKLGADMIDWKILVSHKKGVRYS